MALGQVLEIEKHWGATAIASRNFEGKNRKYWKSLQGNYSTRKLYIAIFFIWSLKKIHKKAKGYADP